MLLFFVIEGKRFVRFHMNIGCWLLAVSLIASISRCSIRYRLNTVSSSDDGSAPESETGKTQTEDTQEADSDDEQLHNADAAVDRDPAP